MKFMRRVAWLILMMLAGQVSAYESADEMIDDKLRILDAGPVPTQIKMLQRLVWSGLTDARLYDRIGDIPPAEYQREDLNKNELNLLAHRIRALGFSGDARYRDFLERVRTTAGYRKLRGHAEKAKADLVRFSRWHEKLANSDFSIGGKSYEVATYMKMLSIDDPQIQRLGARATHDERQRDTDLLASIAGNLKAAYQKQGLPADAQDAAAWYSKALGVNAPDEYRELLIEVAENTPYRKIRKYTLKYIE